MRFQYSVLWAAMPSIVDVHRTARCNFYERVRATSHDLVQTTEARLLYSFCSVGF